MRRPFTAVLLASCLACSAGGEGEAPASGAASTADEGPGIPAESLGLAPGSLTESPEPPLYTADESAPGERPPVEPLFPGAPPVIPHGVADFLPITPDSNMCIVCHAVQVKEEGGPTPIPEDHYVDLRNAPDKVREDIAGARYRCTACHVARTDAPPLVANR